MQTWAPQDEDGKSSGGKVCCQAGAARHGAPCSAGKAHNDTIAIPHAADAMQGPVNAGPVVVAKLPDLQQPCQLLPGSATSG